MSLLIFISFSQVNKSKKHQNPRKLKKTTIITHKYNQPSPVLMYVISITQTTLGLFVLNALSNVLITTS